MDGVRAGETRSHRHWERYWMMARPTANGAGRSRDTPSREREKESYRGKRADGRAWSGAREKGRRDEEKRGCLVRSARLLCRCCCCTDAQPMDAFFRRSPNHCTAEENRTDSDPASPGPRTLSSPPPLSFPRVSNDSSRDFEGVARLAADQPINKITRLRFYRVDASSLFPSSISLSRIYAFRAFVHILPVTQFLLYTCYGLNWVNGII